MKLKVSKPRLKLKVSKPRVKLKVSKPRVKPKVSKPRVKLKVSKPRVKLKLANQEWNLKLANQEWNLKLANQEWNLKFTAMRVNPTIVLVFPLGENNMNMPTSCLSSIGLPEISNFPSHMMALGALSLFNHLIPKGKKPCCYQHEIIIYQDWKGWQLK